MIWILAQIYETYYIQGGSKVHIRNVKTSKWQPNKKISFRHVCAVMPHTLDKTALELYQIKQNKSLETEKTSKCKIIQKIIRKKFRRGA